MNFRENLEKAALMLHEIHEKADIEAKTLFRVIKVLLKHEVPFEIIAESTGIDVTFIEKFQCAMTCNRKTIEIAIKMLKRNIPINEVAEDTELDMATVEKLQSELVTA